jgi:hypothetical protein
MSAEAVFNELRNYKRELTGEGLSGVDVASFQAIFATWKPADKNPTALSDGAAFFKSVRDAFGALTQAQVDGFQVLLQEFGVARWPLSWCAYGLATSWHETAARMEPVKEAFWLSEDWRKTNLRYYPWYGRGFCQLTWEANYKRADDELGLGGALIANPDKALDPVIAARIITVGMERGWFTKHKLADHLPMTGQAGFDAYSEARRIINGTDKASVIAKEAQQFEAALISGGWQ